MSDSKSQDWNPLPALESMFASSLHVEETIGMFRLATEANLHTAGRAGNTVVLTPKLADDVMITGDLHGNRRNFDLIQKVAELDRRPRRHLVLQEVCHGGPSYPEGGGCMSHTVLEDVARLKVKYPDRVHFLLGNHELAELADYPIQKNRQMLNLSFRLGLQRIFGQATEKVRHSYFPFLRSCPLAVLLPGGVFVSHSVPEKADTRPFDHTVFKRSLTERDYRERNGLFQLVWGRDYRVANARAFAELVGARVLINGHEPCPEGFHVPNDLQVIIDCCGERAAYLILPTDRELTHAAIVERIQNLA